MSVLFTVPVPPIGVVLHVLQIRNRTAFLARELGLAAGASADGAGFLHNIIHEWAASLDEDDDVAQLVGAELDALKREVPLPADTTMELVLFATGAERVLMRSRLRHARSLIVFLHSEVLSRVLTLQSDADDDGDDSAPAGPDAARAETPESARDVVACTQVVTVVVRDRTSPGEVACEAITTLAGELYGLDLIEDDVYGALRVEAVEALLGRRLRTRLPVFVDPDDVKLAS